MARKSKVVDTGMVNFIEGIDMLEKDRGIDKQSILDALEEALEKAYRKFLADNEAKLNSPGRSDIEQIVVGRPLTKEEASEISFKKEYSPEDNIEVIIDAQTGDTKIYEKKLVVQDLDEDDEDDDTWINEEIEEFVSYAQETDPSYQIGDIFVTDVNVSNFGRLSAIHAKQVVKQKIRELEKDIVYNAYADDKDELIEGVIDRVADTYAIIDLSIAGKPSKSMGFLPQANQIPNERLIPGNKLLTYVVDVDKEAKGAQVMLSRSEPNFLKRLFEREVADVYDGKVVIKSISREAGDRAKVAAYSTVEGLDPIGSLVGVKNANIQAIQREIGDERIDVVKYDENIEQFIINTLAPSKVLQVNYDEETRAATVVVDDDQLSLAIGKKGQNVRLAVRLTGCSKIDIIPLSKAIEQGIYVEPVSVKEPKTIDFDFETPKEKPARKKKVKETPVVDEYVPSQIEEEIEDDGPVISLEQLVADIREATPNRDIKIKKDTSKKKQPKEEVEEVTFLDEEKPTEKPVVPMYTEEELEEIRRAEEEEKKQAEDFYDDVDYDEYDEYYD